MSLELIRVLFPRWNFFDHVGYQFLIEVKQTGSQDWLPLPFTANRSLGGLFINPEVTRLHAEMTLVENFVQDIQALTGADGKIDSKEVEDLTSFKMVRALVMNRLMVHSPTDMQFRISAKSDNEVVVLYVSNLVEAAR